MRLRPGHGRFSRGPRVILCSMDETDPASEPPRRIVVISDTHLGRPRAGICRAEGLRPLWQGADQFIINGDVAEVQNARMQIDAAREVDRLYELTEQEQANRERAEKILAEQRQ